MTTVLTQIELLTKLAEENGWESWLGRDLQPSGYDHSSLVRVTAFSTDVAEHAQVRPVLDYEAAVAVQLRHKGIVPTLRAGLDRKYWFAEELIVGESVGDVVHQLRERGYPTLTVPLTLAIGVQICEALQSAHGAKNAAGWSLNAVHGGIDLDVVLLTYEGVVRVREFGVAKARRQAWLSRVGGLPPRRICYISPEEARGRPADARSDVYGVGAVLYELLTGAPPVSGADALKAIADGVLHLPSSHNPKVTPQLDTIVMRALSVDPVNRYENCDHLRHDLLRLANDPSKALERVPRILSQLFPGKQSQWAEIQQFERRREWVMVQGFLEKLLIPAEDEDPTGLHVMPVHAHEPSPFEDDVESALDALERPQGQGWESGSVGDAAAKMNGMWDDTSANARNPLHQHEDLDSTIQVGNSPQIRGEQDVSQTLPTGVPALLAAPAVVPVLDVAATHMAYKPTPMPEAPVVAEPAVEAEPRPVVTPTAPEPAPVPQKSAEPAPASAALPEFFEIPAEVDDDEDEPFVEPFAIAELVEAPELQPRDASTKAVLEIIRTAHGRALDIQVLDSPMRRYRKEGGALTARLVGGKATLKLKQPMGGWVRRGRNPREDLPAETKFTMASGDAAEFRDGDVTYHVRVFNPPIPPKSERQIITAEDLKIYAVAIAVSLVLHGVGGLATLLTSYLGVELTVKAPEQVEVFAEGALPKDKPKVEKPKPKVEKPKPKRLEPKPPTTDPSEAQAKIPKAVRQQLDKRLRNNNVPRSEDKADQLISALSTPVKGDGATIKDVVTNIDAIARPGSRGAAFNVTGTLGNLPEGGVNIATSAGGNRIGDIGGSVASDVGKLDKREGSGKVRGKARGVKALSKVTGSLSKGEVWEVIQKHNGQIQACYERQLGKNPGLAGKLTFEWIVKTNGSVGTVKEANNTLGDSAVSKCVSGVIKKMKFPRPKGGEVEIVFPWIFKAG